MRCKISPPPTPNFPARLIRNYRVNESPFEKLHPSPRMGRRRRRRLDVNRYEGRKRIFARTNRISPIFFFLFFFAINFIRFPSHLFSSISFLLYDIFTFSLSLSRAFLFFFQYFSINRRRISLMEYIYIARCTNITIRADIYFFFYLDMFVSCAIVARILNMVRINAMRCKMRMEGREGTFTRLIIIIISRE